ncbi:hypothetical protein CKO15_04605 [Halorhodospira abdelmalekii]|uniref:M90 family metallopeptidase n=1 Tax=Halorhodospira abdelmalekii TaxID=421629 RepID=UPI0019053060|nr:M90 family metallopeptidase [Halorhodospira abdelmalekii]MBK1734577.1 hypothetical protein [Halorhodospira abdelmalekii]
MGWLRNWRRRRLARGRNLPALAWSYAEASLPGLRRLGWQERRQLEALAVAFLDEKSFSGVAGASPDEAQLASIALQAVVPVRELGLDWYAPWRSVVLYPAGFVATHEYVDDDGVVHLLEGPLIGEAWEGGPLVLSLEDALRPAGAGSCVVVHECAHKLDMAQGEVNGLPPLPATLAVEVWARVFQQAYERLGRYVETAEAGEDGGEGGAERDESLWLLEGQGATLGQGLGTLDGSYGSGGNGCGRRCDRDNSSIAAFDPYAAEDPGEFFAVASETYFADPRRLRRAFPEVHEQLRQFYGWELPSGRGGMSHRSR